MPPPRYAPHRAFPPHAFVPGQTARHTRDEREVAARAPEDWREDEDYLFGVDLYHAGFLWEAHEAWERPWLASTDERQRRLLQALIQLAAACLKLEMNDPSSSETRADGERSTSAASPDASREAATDDSPTRSGAAKLARAASAKLRALGDAEFMGLAPAALASAIDAFFARSPVNASGRPPLLLRTTAQPPGGSLA